jgi:hypothetical protein
MSDLADFVSLLAEPGPWTFAYVDGSPSELTRPTLEADLAHAKAPAADVACLLRAFDAAPGLDSPSARYNLVRDGELIVNAALAGLRIRGEFAGYDSVPPVLPMLWHSRELSAAVLRRGTRSGHLTIGTEDVMAALQTGRVATLLLDVRLWKSGKTLEALAAEPWLGERENAEAVGYGPIPMAEALARAALLSGARVVVEEHADEIARSARAARPPQAILRAPTEHPLLAAAA